MIDQTIENLSQGIEEAQEKMRDFKIDKNTGYIYFLGLTGSGKSTLINYMIYEDTLGFQKVKGKIKILSPEGDKYPIIGSTNNSCTSIPEIFKDFNKQIFYVDPPGFMDTEGVYKEILNAYSNARMFQRGTQTKVVIVIEHSTLQSGRGCNFPEIAKRLFELFPADFDRLTHSIVILITKVSLHDYQQKDIIDDVRSISRDNKNMPVECKAMIETAADNDNIHIFPMPSYLQKKNIQSLKKKLVQMKPTMLSSDAAISLNSDSKNTLEKLSQSVIEEINKCSKDIKNHIEVNFINKEYKNVKEYENIIGKLRKALTILQNQLEIGFKQSFLQFAANINLHKSIVEKVIKGMNQIQFCRTLSTEINPTNSLILSIRSCLKQALNEFELKLQKIATKQEIQAINSRHSAENQRRNQQFRQQIIKMQKQSAKRQQQSRQQIRKQREQFEKQMEAKSKEYNAMFQQLQEQIRKKNEQLQKAEQERKQQAQYHRQKIQQMHQRQGQLQNQMNNQQLQWQRSMDKQKQQYQSQLKAQRNKKPTVIVKHHHHKKRGCSIM